LRIVGIHPRREDCTFPCRRRGFEAVVTYWPSKPKRVLRVSAQLYNTIDEYERLSQALLELL